MTIEKADVYFIDGEMTVAGQFGSIWNPEDGGTVPPPNPGPEGSWEYTPVLWKGKGTTEHPQIGSGELTGRFFRIGKAVDLQIFLKIEVDTVLGPAVPYWYFQPFEIMPELEGVALSAVGTCRAWQGGDRNAPGVAFWSAAVGGSLKYGIRCIFEEEAELNRTKPYQEWDNGDTLNLSIKYELP